MKPISPKDLTRLGLLGGTALVLFTFEALVPRPLPWMKLGLGNLAVMLALLVYGFVAALGVSAIKLFVGGLVSGSLGGPAFVIAGGAGMASLTVVAGVSKAKPDLFSPVGLSTLGALIHQSVQLLLAYLYIGHAALFSLLPIFLATGLLSGILIGLLVYWTLGTLRANGRLDP